MVEVEPHRPNVIAHGGEGSPRVLLTSHLDVVEAGEIGRWTHDPFAGEVDDGTLYGRGACDAKGSVAAMAGAIVALSEDPPCEVVLAAVMGEEHGALGSKHLAAQDKRFDAAVVGEPTGLAIAISQKGRLGIALDILGDSSHPTRASAEANPILRLAEVMGFLRDFAEEVRSRDEGSFVVLGVSAGEGGGFTPPERCSVRMSWWFSPRMDHDAAIDSFQSPFGEFAERTGISWEVRFHRGAQSYALDQGHPLVTAAGEAAESVLGRQAEVGEFPASCDMYVFGREGIPAIVLGPGDLALAHAPDESVALDEVAAASRIYAELVKILAGKDDPKAGGE